MDVSKNKNWIHVLRSGKNSIEDIATKIVLNCSAVLLGDKPASTITFYNNKFSGNSTTSWENYKKTIFKEARLKYLNLYSNGNYTLILLFDTYKLSRTLNSEDISMFLKTIGYNVNLPLEEKLYLLKSRFEHSIPHEIGVFLGLPLKDVMGFMGLNTLKESCRLGWRIYGDKELSIKLYLNYEKCKEKMIFMLSNNTNPMDILSQYPHY